MNGLVARVRLYFIQNLMFLIVYWRKESFPRTFPIKCYPKRRHKALADSFNQ